MTIHSILTIQFDDAADTARIRRMLLVTMQYLGLESTNLRAFGTETTVHSGLARRQASEAPPASKTQPDDEQAGCPRRSLPSDSSV